MEIDDALYKAFLVELEALEKFRITYTGLYPGAPLGREDQDVRRLIEALAMFSTRTRLAAQRGIGRSTMRIFRQHFPYVLNPMPAMAILKANLSPSFVDVAEVPRGATAILTPEDGSIERLYFNLLAPIRLLPIELERVDIMRRGPEGYRLLLSFESGFARNDEIKEVQLYVDHLNDLISSLTVHYQLKRHLRAASIWFDDDTADRARPCKASFGAPRAKPSEIEAFEHPLQRARASLHFPQQELFITFEVSAQPRNWRRFTIALDLDARWPAQLRLTRDAFELNAAPMINIRRDMATPVECDGTKERYSVQHSDSNGAFRMHSVLGVYRLDGDGLVPLRPGAIERGTETYEIETDGYGDRRRAWVCLDLPNAFEEPIRVAIDAFWHQPVFNEKVPVEYRAALFERHVDGARWAVDRVVPGADNRLSDTQEGLLFLLSIKNQRFLGLDEIVFLLEAFGAKNERYLRDVVAAIDKVDFRSKPFARATAGFKYIYRVTFAELDISMLPMLDLFAAKLLDILKAWSTEDVVELEVVVPSLEFEACYPEGEVKA